MNPQETPGLLARIMAAPLPTSATLAARNGLVIVVTGTPKPKGSLRHVGNGRMVEQVKGSGTWRQAVARAARQAAIGTDREIPFLGPVVVEATVTVHMSRTAEKRGDLWPHGRNHGDADKHARNILDALEDAGVVRNDAQVVELLIRKAYPCSPLPDVLAEPGAVIYLYPIGDATDADS